METKLMEDKWNSLYIHKESTCKGKSSFVLISSSTDEEYEHTKEVDVILYPHELGTVVSKLLSYCIEHGIVVDIPPTAT